MPVDVDLKIKVTEKALDAGLVVSTQAYGDIIKGALHRFLHPLHGGLDGNGWEIGEDISIANLLEFLHRDEEIGLSPEIGFVSEVSITPGQVDYSPPDRPFEEGGGGKQLLRVAD